MRFRDRVDAGQQLADTIKRASIDGDCVVLGLPRGGVPVAYEVAESLGARLDVIVVRKLGVPFQPELAMGAIGEGGVRVENRDVLRSSALAAIDLDAVEERERVELERRAHEYRGGRPRLDLSGRLAVIVDDGIATGSTARAACQVARASGASRVVVAAPVASRLALVELVDVADQVLCVHSPEPFYAVGEWYRDFSQTSDAEVVDLLRRSGARPRGGRPPAWAQDSAPVRRVEVEIDSGSASLVAHVTIPEHRVGTVVFAHGSGSGRHSPRNRMVAGVLNDGGLATVLVDLLAGTEEFERSKVHDIGLLAGRLSDVSRWVRRQPDLARGGLGYFGASTGAAAALWSAAQPGSGVSALVSRGGRPDLAAPWLRNVTAPTLLIVGECDDAVLALNRTALSDLGGPCRLVVVPGASHLFEEAGALEAVAAHTCARGLPLTSIPALPHPTLRSRPEPPGEMGGDTASAEDPGAAEATQVEDGLRLHRWSDRAIIVVAITALASGFGQYGVVAALGDVSTQLGHVANGTSIADKVGLSGTQLGVGLAIIRLASLGSLPLIGMADRLGRRRMLLGVTILGLALTAVSAVSPAYWWFVVIFALGRPLLSATNALAQVMAAEETGSRDRAAAVALVAGGYGIGAGASAILHSLASGTLGFRGIFACALVPLGVVWAIRGHLEEPSRFMVARVAADHPMPVLGAVGPRFRRRVLCLALIAFAISVITGPANSFAFLYAQDVLHLAGYVTAIMVVVAGAVGLLGLLSGRWLADRIGRRPTCSAAMVAIALTATLAYTGSRPAFLIGYVLGVLSGSLVAPAVGSLLTELFPTSVRASVTGWWVTAGVLGAVGGLVAFGAVADVGNRFALAAELTFLPMALAAALFWLLPETKGREPETLWPDEGGPAQP